MPSSQEVHNFTPREQGDIDAVACTASDLHRRVAQYFTGADPRTRMREMVALARAVDHVECAHALEDFFLKEVAARLTDVVREELDPRARK